MNIAALTNLFLRRRCLSCQAVLNIQAAAASLCSECARKLPDAYAYRCQQCANCIAPSTLNPCIACVKNSSTTSLRHCYAASSYLAPSTDIVKQLKTYGDASIADFAAGKMAQSVLIPVANGETCLVAPIPSARDRWVERGFNPAQLLVRPLVSALNKRYPVGTQTTSSSAPRTHRHQPRYAGCFSLVFKVRETAHQIGLNRQDRQNNLAGVFALSDPKKLANQGVLLVDDVMTTGATLETVAKILREAGASWVDSVVFARTPKG